MIPKLQWEGVEALDIFFLKHEIHLNEVIWRNGITVIVNEMKTHETITLTVSAFRDIKQTFCGYYMLVYVNILDFYFILFYYFNTK